jgi:hypothetical protein
MLVVALMTIGGAACAAPVTWNFVGTVTHIDTNAFDSVYTLGQTVNLSLEFDLANGIADGYPGTATSNSPGMGAYSGVINSFTMDIGSEVLGGFSSDETFLVQNALDGTVSRDKVAFMNFEPGGNSIGTWENINIQFVLTGASSTVFSDATLPDTLDLEDFQWLGGTIEYEEPWDPQGSQRVYIQFAAVPEPATAGLLGLSSLLLFVIRRMQKAYGLR